MEVYRVAPGRYKDGASAQAYRGGSLGSLITTGCVVEGEDDDSIRFLMRIGFVTFASESELRCAEVNVAITVIADILVQPTCG